MSNNLKIINSLSNFAKTKKLKIKEIAVEDFVAYEVAPKDILAFIDYLKCDNDLKFTILTDLFGADFPDRKKRFEVVYNLLSLKLNARIILKAYLAEDEEIESLAKLHSSACWYEREVFDMYGVKFTNCPDNRRILTDYGFKGHPLRKDFPLTGHVEVRYDEKLEEVIYEPVKLDHEFRDFDFASPWQGPSNISQVSLLPGDEKATKE